MTIHDFDMARFLLGAKPERRDQDCRDLGDATIEPGATERPLTPPSIAMALVQHGGVGFCGQPRA
jgi:predicted dehydrogenase